MEDFRFREYISFKRGRDFAIGRWDPEDRAYSTLVSASVEGLNIMGIVTADRLVGRIASRHYLVPPPPPPDKRPHYDQPSIVTVGTFIENLRIGGQRVSCDSNLDIQKEWPTLGSIRANCKEPKLGVWDGDAFHTSAFTNVECRGLEPGAVRTPSTSLS